MPEVLKTITAADGTTFSMRFWNDGSGDLAPIQHVADIVSTVSAGTSVTVSSLSVTASAQSLNTLLGTPKAGRTAVELQNLGTGKVYVGGSGVTVGNGRLLDSAVGDGSWSVPLAQGQDVYLIGDAAATVIASEI